MTNELDFTGDTTIFQPGELSALRDKVDGALGRDISKTPATGAPSRVAVIKWPSGASTRISGRLNIGRDPHFSPCAGEMASELLVSRQHAVLELCSEGIRVRDLHSRNGTFVDGVRVPSGGAVIVDRDARILLGLQSVVQLTLPCL